MFPKSVKKFRVLLKLEQASSPIAQTPTQPSDNWQCLMVADGHGPKEYFTIQTISLWFNASIGQYMQVFGLWEKMHNKILLILEGLICGIVKQLRYNALSASRISKNMIINTTTTTTNTNVLLHVCQADR